MQRSALSRRSFNAQLTTYEEDHPRLLKRVYIAYEIMKAVKICTEDVIVIRSMDLANAMEGLSLKEGSDGIEKSSTSDKFALGTAWASYSSELNGTTVKTSSHILDNAGVEPGGVVSISTLATSGVAVADATSLSLVDDTPGEISPAFVQTTLAELRYVCVDHVVTLNVMGASRHLRVAAAEPAGSAAYQVTGKTQVTVAPAARAPRAPRRLDAAGNLRGYAAVGGLGPQLAEIRELVEWPLTRPELFRHLGLRPPRGILLHGPPGTGKTLVASAIAAATQSTLFTINGPSLSSAYHGETEAKLRAVFEDAKRASPSVIVIDEVDALAPNREDSGEVERRVVATLLTLMDGLEGKPVDEGETDAVSGVDAMSQTGTSTAQASSLVASLAPSSAPAPDAPHVVVIAATNRPNAIDPALRRPGRFDKEFEIGVPDADARLSILEVLLRQTPHTLTPAELAAVAAQTHGFVGADLAALVHGAGLAAIKRVYRGYRPEDLETYRVSAADIAVALRTARPSALREVTLETPHVRWDDIGGQSGVKARLVECVQWPLQRAADFKRLGVQPPRGVLLYGPPGCSKTLIAKALATEAGLNFIAVKAPEVFNKYVGESERAVRELFKKARAASPSIVFIDEIDALAAARGGTATDDRVLMSLLIEMDGIEELTGVIVLAATNRPEVIDPALMRPGRLDRILYVGPPDRESRAQIFKINMAKMATDGVDVDELADMTEGCSGAEIVSICQDAALLAMNEDINILHVEHRHFVTAANSIRRRITPEMIEFYEQWRDSSGVRNA